jgi:hypothetical protein
VVEDLEHTFKERDGAVPVAEVEDAKVWLAEESRRHLEVKAHQLVVEGHFGLGLLLESQLFLMLGTQIRELRVISELVQCL